MHTLLPARLHTLSPEHLHTLRENLSRKAIPAHLPFCILFDPNTFMKYYNFKSSILNVLHTLLKSADRHTIKDAHFITSAPAYSTSGIPAHFKGKSIEAVNSRTPSFLHTIQSEYFQETSQFPIMHTKHLAYLIDGASCSTGHEKYS